MRALLSRTPPRTSRLPRHPCAMASSSATSGNQLGRELSPYLRQHADNPVHWRPWGAAAFAEARAQQKPVFLSSGYSSCHWCHVMAHESFEDATVAALLNESFIPVKLDKEENPGVDSVFMTYVQATTGGGGWPMSVWLTPDGHPFLGGTYYPKEDNTRTGQRGFITLLRLVADLWATRRSEILDSAADVVRQLQAATQLKPAVQTSPTTLFGASLEELAEQLMHRYDATHGGFGGPPKFPRPCELDALLTSTACRVTTADGVHAAVCHTLRAMCLGGMYDQIGGGFARYSVDELWHVPHFEKMGYDMPQLVNSLCIAAISPATSTDDAALFARTARGTLDFLRREMMKSCAGAAGMCASLDADSVDPSTGKLREGFYYAWDAKDVDEALRLGGISADAAAAFVAAYDVRPGGNVIRSRRSDPHNEFAGLNVLYDTRPHGDVEQHAASFGACRQALDKHREAHKPRPALDGTIIAAWNGMAISAFSRASRQLCMFSSQQQVHFPCDTSQHAVREYLRSAEQMAAFAQTHLWNEHSRRLIRSARVRDDPAGSVQTSSAPGCAADYAALAQGCIDLFSAGTPDGTRWLLFAEQLLDALHIRFGDGTGGLYTSEDLSADDAAGVALPLRPRDDYDGAEPSAAAHAAAAHVALARLYSQDTQAGAAHATAARRLGEAYSSRWSTQPMTMPALLNALAPQLLDTVQVPPCVVLVTGDLLNEGAQTLLDAAWTAGGWSPGRVILPIDTERDADFWKERNPQALESARTAIASQSQGAAVAVVCTDNACRPPVSDCMALAAMLAGTPMATQPGATVVSTAAGAVAQALFNAAPLTLQRRD